MCTRHLLLLSVLCEDQSQLFIYVPSISLEKYTNNYIIFKWNEIKKTILKPAHFSKQGYTTQWKKHVFEYLNPFFLNPVLLYLYTFFKNLFMTLLPVQHSDWIIVSTLGPDVLYAYTPADFPDCFCSNHFHLCFWSLIIGCLLVWPLAMAFLAKIPLLLLGLQKKSKCSRLLTASCKK